MNAIDGYGIKCEPESVEALAGSEQNRPPERPIMSTHSVAVATNSSNPFIPLTINLTTAAIPLTQGKYAIIDVATWPVVGLHKWSARQDKDRWYAQTYLKQKCILLHQLLCPCIQGYVADHKNRDGLDNRMSNLRPATHQQNCANGKKRRSNTGFRGAYFDISKRKFVAKIMHRGKLRNLGHWDNPIDAARAYDAAAIETYGEFAQVNFPESAEKSAGAA